MQQTERPLADVREGMTVVDAAGEEVGTVEFVKMGDPRAASTQGNQSDDDGLLGFFVDSEPDVPGPARRRFLSHGYLKVDGGGMMEGDRYIGGDQVSGVSNGVVVLSVPRDGLIDER